MSDVTLGQISSQPNEKGEHTLKCPSCSSTFQSVITKDGESDLVRPIACPLCRYSDEPKVFIAAAHQNEVSSMAMEYVQKELNKSLRKMFR